MKSLILSPYFSILADECEDVTTCEELSICCRRLVNGRPEEHFVTILHITATDAASITKTLNSFILEKQLDYRKLVGQAYDGAAVFSGSKTGVQTRMGINSAHALYFHCACHRLQLASIQVAEITCEIKQIFGMMSNLWKLFYYSPKKAETLKEVQSALQLPELKIVKPSDTRWLSHERCMRAIKKELAALIITLQQLYEATGNAEALGLCSLLSSYVVISGIVFLAEVMDTMAKINAAIQRKIVDFSKIPSHKKILIDELTSLKSEESEGVLLFSQQLTS